MADSDRSAHVEDLDAHNPRVIASVGDEQNAPLMLTAEADFGAGPVTLPAARLYLLDEDEKIKAEQIIVFAAPS